MKFYWVLIAIIILPLVVASQDLIHTKDGETIQAVVQEVQPELIKYKRFNFQDGPLYTLERTKVTKIVFSNGLVDWIDKEAEKVFEARQATPTPPAIEEQKAESQIAPPGSVEPEPQPSPELENTEDPISTKMPEKPVYAEVKESPYPSISLGIIAGLNAATGVYNYNPGPNPPLLSILAAPTAGMKLDIRLSKGFSIESMLAYRGKGDRIDMEEWYDKIDEPSDQGDWVTINPNAEGFIQTYIGYGELSIHPVIHLNDGFRIGLGGYVAAGLHGQEKSDYSISFYFDDLLIENEVVKSTRNIEFTDVIALEDTELTRYINRFDYGLSGFLGFGTQPLTVELAISYGLQNWEPDYDLFSNNDSPTETQHLTGLLSLTYWFN